MPFWVEIIGPGMLVVNRHGLKHETKDVSPVDPEDVLVNHLGGLSGL